MALTLARRPRPGNLTMPSVSADVEVRQRRLRELLLDLLRSANLPHWPGCDGTTVEEVLLAYPAAAAAGRVPDLAELLCDHPDWQDELRAFFAAAPSPSDCPETT
jgi:hypothetical protein